MSLLLDLTVTDIRQHLYCPRIPYYRYILPLERPVTAKMDLGKEEHETTSARESRRSLKAYGIKEGERRFGVDLYSESLGRSSPSSTRWPLGSDCATNISSPHTPCSLSTRSEAP